MINNYIKRISRIRMFLPGAVLGCLFFCGGVGADEGYYKDILMDAGIGLSENSELPAVNYLGLEWEFIMLPYTNPTQDDYDIQNRVFIGDVHDENGRLLYPDGAPRFRNVQVQGGSSFTHGTSLGAVGRQRFRDYVGAGGSYTGTCAGFSISSLCRSDQSPSPYPTYLHIWPAKCHYSGLSGGDYLNHIIPTASPLLDYYDFGSDNYIANLYHNMGSYAIEGDPFYWCANSEVLLIHDNPGHQTDGNVSALAYKADADSGRLTLIGSHPESVTSGERRDLMAALLRYAMDGNGGPKVKAPLQNNVTRYMNDNYIAKHEKIGDKQYHHFTVEIPSGTTQLLITLDGDDVRDLDLFARFRDFAFRYEPDVIEATNGTSSDETISINNPSAGIWYIGVKGCSTVRTTRRSWGQDYLGNVEVLNGLEYSITTAWDIPRGDMEVDGKIDKLDLKVLSDHWLENNLYARKLGDLEGHWKFDETSGTSAEDASGMRRHGKVYNRPIWRSRGGRYGGGLSFDEVDDYVRIDDFDYTNYKHEFSMSFWFRISDVMGDGYQYMFSHGDYEVNNSLNVYFRESEIINDPNHVSTRLQLQDGTYWQHYSPTELNDGEWHHYVLSVSAVEGAKIYIDGEEAGSKADVKGFWFNPDTDIYLGARCTLNPARYYGATSEDDGLLDDVRLYSFPLSAGEVDLVYAGALVSRPTSELVCSEFPVGDLNEDGKVDLRDFEILASYWHKIN